MGKGPSAYADAPTAMSEDLIDFSFVGLDAYTRSNRLRGAIRNIVLRERVEDLRELWLC